MDTRVALPQWEPVATTKTIPLVTQEEPHLQLELLAKVTLSKAILHSKAIHLSKAIPHSKVIPLSQGILLNRLGVMEDPRVVIQVKIARPGQL